MARVRLKVNERGELVRRDGTVMGRVESITVELDFVEADGVGGRGAITSGDSNLDLSKNHPQPPTGEPEGQLFDAPDQIKLVWEHYQQTVNGAKRRKLDSTRMGCIRRALKVRGLEECKRAIDGLAVSPHHNGRNEQRASYLDIQYALGMKSESPDERIDKMGSKVDEGGKALSDRVRPRDLLHTVPSELRGIVMNRVNDVIAGRESGTPNLEAERVVRDKLGIEIEVADDGRALGWRFA